MALVQSLDHFGTQFSLFRDHIKEDWNGYLNMTTSAASSDEEEIEQLKQAEAKGRKESIYHDTFSSPSLLSSSKLGNVAEEEADDAFHEDEDAPQARKTFGEAVHTQTAISNEHGNANFMAHPQSNLAQPSLDSPTIPKARSNANDPYSVLEATLRLQIADLMSQVSSLNSKLVSSFGRVGDLEDTLDGEKHKSDRLARQVKTLTDERTRWEERVEGGMLVEKIHVQTELTRMMDRVIEETDQRGKAETDKEAMEKELADLTASLFGEANNMVALERAAKLVAIVKSDSLEDRLKDTETIIGHQAEQMQELGKRLEGLELERDELSSKVASLESDPTRSLAVNGATDLTRNETGLVVAGKILPPLLTDHLPHHEFILFIRHLTRARSTTLARPIDSLSTSVSAGYASPLPPAPPGSNMSPEHYQALVNQLPLAGHLSQPFLKRCIEEDAEPTLRLDLAPGLNWLSRRSVTTAIIEGQLIIEPSYGGASISDKCALCGTSLDKFYDDLPVSNTTVPTMRKLMPSSLINAPGWARWTRSTSGSSHTAPSSPTLSHSAQLHIFKLADPTSTNRYPLCPNYCLKRLRTVCEFWDVVRKVERGLILGDINPNTHDWPHTPAIAGAGNVPAHDINAQNLAQVGLGVEIGSVPHEHIKTSERMTFSDSNSTVKPLSQTNQAAAQISDVLQKGEPTTQDGTLQSQKEQSNANADFTGPAMEDDGKTKTNKIAESIPRTESPLPQATGVPLTSNNEIPAAEAKNESTETLPFVDANEASEEGTKPPPLPKRSQARTVPSPVVDHRPPLERPSPSQDHPPAPPPRRRPVPLPSPSSSNDIHPAVGPWAEQCWNDITKLKQTMFWSRIGIVSNGSS